MSVPPPPGVPWPPPGPPVSTAEERNWAMAGHIGSIVTAWIALGLFAPLVVLLVKGPTSAFVRRHAVESLNFQINALIWTVVFGLLIFVGVGLVLLPLYGLFYLVCLIIATVRASSGGEFRYPLTMRMVR